MRLIKAYDMDLNEEWSIGLQELLVAGFPEVYPKELNVRGENTWSHEDRGFLACNERIFIK